MNRGIVSAQHRSAWKVWQFVLLGAVFLLFLRAPQIAYGAPPTQLGLPPQAHVPSWANSHTHFMPTRGALRRAEHASTSIAEHGGKPDNSPNEDGATELEPPSGRSPEQPSQANELGFRCQSSYCPSPPLRWYGGSVQHSPVVHLVLWGSNWNNSPGTAARKQLEEMFKGISGTPYQEILSQYFDSSGHISKTITVDSWVDTRTTAPALVGGEAVASEAEWAANSHSGSGWAANPEAQFVVLPAPGTTYEAEFHGFCAYHSWRSTNLVFDFVPYVGDEPFKHSCQSYDEGGVVSNVTSMLASHEYAEAATDPFYGGAGVGGWQDREGEEVSDICISGDDQVGTGNYVQGQYDDHQNACSLGDEAPSNLLALSEPATQVASDSAELNATIYPEGNSTTYWFEYGPTTSYGTKVPASGASAGSGSGGVSEHAQIGGLSTGSVYHYRVVASSSAGTVYGEDLTIRPSTWRLRVQGDPATSDYGWFGSVSCGTTTSCVATGYHYKGGENLGLSYVGAGASWKEVAIASTIYGSNISLEGVSCDAANSCTAVGEVENGTEVHPVAEHWNGSSWTNQTVPAPEGSKNSRLLGVSCPKSNECVAVGYMLNSEGIFVDFSTLWNGSAWSTLSTPSPLKITQSLLENVSCAQSTNFCVAVGWANTTERAEKVTLTRFGNQWTEEEAATAGTWGTLSGVSCASVRFCIQVGETLSGSSIEAWNGERWTTQTSATLEGEAEDGSLSSVSCASEEACTAVGNSYSSYNGQPMVLAESWNGTTWTEQSTPRESTRMENHFNQVACPAAQTCVAVGSSIVPGFRAPILATYGRGPEYSAEGSFGSTGSEPGQLQGPEGDAVDSSGNVWVADSENNRIEEFNSKGEFVLQVGTKGSGNGQLLSPQDVAVTASGNIWVTDKGNDRVEEFTSKGEYVTKFGLPGSENGHFNNPWGLAIGPNGHLYVTDWLNNTVQEFTETGSFVRSFGGTGSGPGQFSSPAGIAVDSSGSIWVVDVGNRRVEHFSSTGTYSSQFGSQGTGNGQFEGARAIDVTSSGNLVVTDRYLGRVEEYSQSGEWLGQFGAGTMGEPEGIAVASGGLLYVPSGSGDRIERWQPVSPAIASFGSKEVKPAEVLLTGSINPHGIATKYHFEYGPTNSYGSVAPLPNLSAGSGTAPIVVETRIKRLQPGTIYHYRLVATSTAGAASSADGTFETTKPSPARESTFGSTGSEAGQLKRPQGDAVDSSGNVWVADSENNRIEEFNSKGEFVLQFGTKGSGNGQLLTPTDIAVTASGNLWVTDKGNNRLEEFTPQGEFIRQVKEGLLGPKFKNPWGLAIGPNGHLYVTDWLNNTVQEFGETGSFVRSFGSEGSGSGQFSSPAGIAVDSSGTIWVVDVGNRRVEHFSSTGTYLGQFGSKGTGNGQFEGARAIDVTSSGNLVVTDRYLGRIEEFSQAGAWLGQFGAGTMAEPEGIAAASGGVLYVPSASGNRIERWKVPSPDSTTSGATGVTSSGATLNGSINPHGLATTYWFEYGPSTNYGKVAPLSEGSVGSGSKAVAVSTVIEHLKSGRTYHFRLSATNSSGTTYGTDETFVTP